MLPLDRVGRGNGASYVGRVVMSCASQGLAGVWPPSCATPSSLSSSVRVHEQYR